MSDSEWANDIEKKNHKIQRTSSKRRRTRVVFTRFTAWTEAASYANSISSTIYAAHHPASSWITKQQSTWAASARWAPWRRTAAESYWNSSSCSRTRRFCFSPASFWAAECSWNSKTKLQFSVSASKTFNVLTYLNGRHEKSADERVFVGSLSTYNRFLDFLFGIVRVCPDRVTSRTPFGPATLRT